MPLGNPPAIHKVSPFLSLSFSLSLPSSLMIISTSSWRAAGVACLPDHCWHDFARSQPERVLDVLDILYLRGVEVKIYIYIYMCTHIHDQYYYK